MGIFLKMQKRLTDDENLHEMMMQCDFKNKKIFFSLLILYSTAN